MSRIDFMLGNDDRLSALRAASPQSATPLPSLPTPPPSVGPGRGNPAPSGSAINDVVSAGIPNKASIKQTEDLAQDFATDITRNPKKLAPAFIPAAGAGAANAIGTPGFEKAATAATRGIASELEKLDVKPARLGIAMANAAGNQGLANALERVESGGAAPAGGREAPVTFIDNETGNAQELYQGDDYVLTRPVDGEDDSTLYLGSDVSPDQVADIFKQVADVIVDANAADEGLEVDQAELDQILDDHIAGFMTAQAGYAGMAMEEGDSSAEDDRAARTTRARSERDSQDQ